MSADEGDSASAFDFRHLSPCVLVSTVGVESVPHFSNVENNPSFNAVETFDEAVDCVKHTTALSFVNFAGLAGMFEAHV